MAIEIPVGEKKAKKASQQVATGAETTLDLDALLKRIKETKPETGGKGRAPSMLSSKVAESVLQLLEKAKDQEIIKLPLGTTVRTIAVALGTDASKKSQHFYTLSQSVLKILNDKIEVAKDGRTLFIGLRGCGIEGVDGGGVQEETVA